jgi:hypothetical protein
MNKQSFPDSDFNLVEKVDNKHQKEIQELAKSVGESVLRQNLVEFVVAQADTYRCRDE